MRATATPRLIQAPWSLGCWPFLLLATPCLHLVPGRSVSTGAPVASACLASAAPSATRLSASNRWCRSMRSCERQGWGVAEQRSPVRLGWGPSCVHATCQLNYPPAFLLPICLRSPGCWFSARLPVPSCSAARQAALNTSNSGRRGGARPGQRRKEPKNKFRASAFRRCVGEGCRAGRSPDTGCRAVRAATALQDAGS